MADEDNNNEPIKLNEDYNDLVRQMGAWIDKEFLKTLLEANFGSEIEIVDSNIHSAVNSGDNYMSMLYKTTVHYTKNGSEEIIVKRFMIKGTPPGQAIVDIIEDMGIFKIEIFMYNCILPAMLRNLNQYFPKNTPNVSPFAYRCTRENTIVMEDLGESNYRMGRRRKQLNFEHSAATLEALARFHATSLKVFEENPEYFETVQSFSDILIDNTNMDSFLKGGFPEFAKAVGSWEECEKFQPILDDLTSAVQQKMIDNVISRSSYLNVLNHGDAWVNNIMFKYDKDGIVDHAKLIDFQTIRLSSPVLDVHYFLFTSVQVDVFVEKLQQLLKIYHNTLIQSLKYMNIENDYSFDKMLQEFEDRIEFGFVAMVIVRPVVLAKKKVDLANEDESTDDSHPLVENYKNPLYKDTTIEILLHLDSLGYFDILSRNCQDFLQSNTNNNIKNETRPSTAEVHSQQQNFLGRLLASFSKIINEPMCT